LNPGEQGQLEQRVDDSMEDEFDEMSDDPELMALDSLLAETAPLANLNSAFQESLLNELLERFTK
jgi:hypothetical protein